EKALRKEMEEPEAAKGRGELEAKLAENKQAEVRLRQELVESQKQLQAEQAKYLEEEPKPETEEVSEPTPAAPTQPSETETPKPVGEAESKAREEAEKAGVQQTAEPPKTERKGGLRGLMGFLRGKKEEPAPAAAPAGAPGSDQRVKDLEAELAENKKAQ